MAGGPLSQIRAALVRPEKIVYRKKNEVEFQKTPPAIQSGLVGFISRSTRTFPRLEKTAEIKIVFAFESGLTS
jgi:hypothetical protein